jgi:hypothetical protein
MALLWTSIDRYERLGSIRLAGEVGVGEATLDVSFPLEPGLWHVLYLDRDVLDELVDDGHDELEPWAGQLVLHSSAVPPSELASATEGREVARTDIEAARFTIADIAWRERLAAPDGFYEHLDGVHGLLKGAQGVTLMLDGDGSATTFAEQRSQPPRWCIVNLR